MNAPDAPPLLKLIRSDRIVQVERDGDTYTVRVARLRVPNKVLPGLTADQTLDALAREMQTEPEQEGKQDG